MVAYPMRAYAQHKTHAERAEHKFLDLCGGNPGRVPGMCTVIRLAVRIDQGRSCEQAAAAEYLYRWHLALKSRVFGIPHLLGM